MGVPRVAGAAVIAYVLVLALFAVGVAVMTALVWDETRHADEIPRGRP